jgi:hypothetical protein
VNAVALIERHFIASLSISAYATFVSVFNGQPTAMLIVFAYLGLILCSLIGTVDCFRFHGSLPFFSGSRFLSLVPRATAVPILTQGHIFSQCRQRKKLHSSGKLRLLLTGVSLKESVVWIHVSCYKGNSRKGKVARCSVKTCNWASLQNSSRCKEHVAETTALC